MARAYDTRPDLEGYDALTVRRIAKFVAVMIVLFGSQFLADHYGLGRWYRAAILVVTAAVGLNVMWIGAKSLATGQAPPNAVEGPRYAEPDRINFISPRAAASGVILAGAVIIADAVFKLTQI
jgi:hypothetical protein